MITFICDASAETYLITNIKLFNPRSLTICNDLSGVDRIKVEIITSLGDFSKVIDYLKQHYVKPYNGVVVYQTNYYSWDLKEVSLIYDTIKLYKLKCPHLKKLKQENKMKTIISFTIFLMIASRMTLPNISAILFLWVTLPLFKN